MPSSSDTSVSLSVGLSVARLNSIRCLSGMRQSNLIYLSTQYFWYHCMELNMEQELRKKQKKVIAIKSNIDKLLQETNFTKYHKIFMMQDKCISAISDIYWHIMLSCYKEL